MSEVTLEFMGRTIHWSVPEDVGVQLLQTFTQVCGPGREQLLNGEAVVGTTESLIHQLKEKQHEACAYGTREGDGKTCDCKYNRGFISDHPSLRGEVTGCCELRAAIKVLEVLDD